MNQSFLASCMECFGDAVYRTALCRLQNKADAEDVFQDTFLRLHQHQEAQNWSPEHIKAWLLRVAINRCTDLGRRRKHHSILGLDVLPELAARDHTAGMELWDAVQRLPEKQRMVFHLHYGEGYSSPEIAEILNISAGDARVCLSRARSILRKELSDND